MAPLKSLLELPIEAGGRGWSSLDYGFFTSAYGWFNVFLLMLIFGGMILDKMGVRFTGVMALFIMVAGIAMKYWAISTSYDDPTLIIPFIDKEIGRQVLSSSLGYAIFVVCI